MMRKMGRVDANHGQVVDALRQFGCVVRSTAQLGDGFPDLIVGYRGVLVVLEVKDGSKPESARKLTAAEVKFLSEWPRAYVVTSPQDAIEAVVEAARPCACRSSVGGEEA